MNHTMSDGGDAGTNLRRLRIGAVLILIYFVFEITVAITTGSLSLLADAGHELSTFVAISISLIAIHLAEKPATAEKTFGYLRAQILAALVNGVLLLVMAGFIFSQGIDRIADPMEVPSTPMFVMAVGGIGLEIASLAIMYSGQKGDLNIRGSFWHVVNALLGSVAVIIAALFIQLWQIYVADAWAGMLFAVILVWAAYGIIRDSFRILIDAVPPDVDMHGLVGKLRGVPGVVDTHHLHARAITSNMKVFSGHLVVEDIKTSNRILETAKEIVDREYGFDLSTIQLEERGLAEADERNLEANIK